MFDIAKGLRDLGWLSPEEAKRDLFQTEHAFGVMAGRQEVTELRGRLAYYEAEHAWLVASGWAAQCTALYDLYLQADQAAGEWRSLARAAAAGLEAKTRGEP